LDSDYYLSGLFDQVTIQALTAGPVIALSLAILLLLVSGFVSASEVAFFSLTPGDINDIREENAPSDPLIQRLLDRSEYLLAAILIANNFVNVAVVMLCTYGINAIVNFSSAPMLGFILETIVLTFLLLLFGEIMPKIYAQKNSLRFVRSSAPVLNVVERVCRPLSNILVTSTSVINKALVKKKYDLSVDELSKALELTSTEMPEEKEMLSEIIKFYNKTADEIMTPRLDMEDIDIKTSFRTVVDFIIRSGYSRIPVYADSEDNIKGILYIKDLLPYVEKPDTFRWQSLIRPAYFVPETKKIDDLLEEFRTSKIHMAIVVDEFGGTSGIVTMEDILEEIVGEISDEYDEDEKQFIRLADGSLIFEAKILLTDFFRVIDADPTEFGKLTEEVETLAGLLLEIKGDFPRRREIIEYDDYRFLEKLSREVGSHFHALDRTTLYTANRDISYYTVHESFVATIPLVFCEAEKMDPNTQFLKVMMIDEPAILDQAIARIPQEVKEKYTVLKSAPYFLEILDKRVNKGTGVKSLADVLGIKPEEIMAIGDQENDIAMIEYAGVGVAMDNAIPSVKEVANFVTKSNLEDGVAFAIEKYVLN
jgi:putative hemolysin